MVQSTIFNPTIFIQALLAYRVTNHVSQLQLKVCEADSTSGRQRVAWDDATKSFLFFKATILTKHWNIKY